MYYCGRRPLIRKLHICKAAFYLIISDTEKKINSHKVVCVRWIGGKAGVGGGGGGSNVWVDGITAIVGDELVGN